MKNKMVRITVLSFLLFASQMLLSENSFVSKAQAQSIASRLEGTEWEATQPNEIYSPALDESISRQFFCSFEKQGQVSCKVRLEAASKIKNELHSNPVTGRLEYRTVNTPRRMLNWEDRRGTYKLTGSKIYIEFPAYDIVATVQGNSMKGTVTLKLESNQETEWTAKQVSGESSNSSNSADENSTHPNVVRNSEGKFIPASGYRWVNSEDPNDFRVELMPGLIKTETGFRPDKGYRWVNPDDPKDFRVERIP